jgi:aryl-alcohol dehydrogenase-like predicted oxidoreductase
MTEMRFRQLGNSGLTVSVVGLGCNNFGRRIDYDQSKTVIDAALDAGINLFDTADAYSHGGSEEMIGRALAGRRDDVLIATKFGLDMGGRNGPDWGARGSRRYIRRAVRASLTRLGTDYIDLYQYHAPDQVTPIEETLAALHELVVEGTVRYLGSSNLAGWQVVEADYIARADGGTPFISAQNEYSLIRRNAEIELAPACEAVGVGILPYFPLASGLLTGKFRRDEPPAAGTRISYRQQLHTDAPWDVIEGLEKYAAERELSILDVAIGGLAGQPGVGSVIAGATSAEQVAANVAAGRWDPSEDDLDALDAVAPTKRRRR